MEWEMTQGVRLFRLIDRMRRAWTAITPCAELSKSQFGTLMALAHLGGGPGTDGTPPQAQGLRLTQLAHVMHQSPPALSQRIAVLEAMGYVQRTEDAQDRRVTRVCLTQQGHALLKQAYRAGQTGCSHAVHPAEQVYRPAGTGRGHRMGGKLTQC